VMNMSAGVSVCPFAHLENYTVELYLISMHADCGRGLLLLWRRCDTLCTSGFVDDVTSSYGDLHATAETTAPIPTRSCSTVKIGKCTSWGSKSAMYDCLESMT